MYHAVMEPPIGCDAVERDLFVSPRQFETQMADLADRGFRSVSLDHFGDAHDHTVLITFDSDAPQSKRRLFVGTDDYAAGGFAAEEVREVLYKAPGGFQLVGS